jgi:hypothetical protein
MIQFNDDRKLYVQAVLDGQLPEYYITDKELTSLMLKMFDKMIEKHLPQYVSVLH